MTIQNQFVKITGRKEPENRIVDIIININYIK